MMRALISAGLSILILTLLFSACDKATPVAPTGALLTISANPTRIDIDGEATITVIARKDTGTAVNPGTEINFSTSLGAIESIVATDDRGVAETTLAGDGRVGTALIAASSGAAAEVSLEVKIGSLAGSIALQATPSSLPRGGGTIELLALVRDDTGQPLANVTVNFSTDIGRLESLGAALVTNDAGEATDTLTVVGTDLSVLSGGIFEVRAQVAAESGGLLEDVFEILVEGVPATITLQPTPSTIPKTGGVIELVALVRDGAGQPLAGAGVNFLTALGSLASGGSVVSTDASGQARDQLTVTEQDLAAFSGSNFVVTAQTGGFGGELLEDIFTIVVQGSPPVASFTFTGVSGALTVAFTSTSAGQAPLTYEWDFGDGNSSTAASPSNTYGSAGTYTVKLTTTNSFGSDTAEDSVAVPLP